MIQEVPAMIARRCTRMVHAGEGPSSGQMQLSVEDLHAFRL